MTSETSIPSNVPIPVGILGATGSVGRRLAARLVGHPWFTVTALAAKDASRGLPFREAVPAEARAEVPAGLADSVLDACLPGLPCRLVFSALDAAVAGDLETRFAEAGHLVVSNAQNHRMAADVPLLIPEVNPDHLALVREQRFERGVIVTNPNCSVIGLTLALAPLATAFGLEAVHVTTMQAVSGAGDAGAAALDIHDNVIPHIGGEEEKVETEPRKILGRLVGTTITERTITISAACHRVPVSDGHLASVSVKLSRPPTADAVIAAWESFRGPPPVGSLPSAPAQPIRYLPHPDHPQPKLHRGLDDGMGVAVGRLRPCPILDWKFAVLAHNTVRGAAGAAILNAELLVREGLAGDSES